MANPDFSLNELIEVIEEAVQVKVVYNAFFDEFTNTDPQVRELADEIHSFGLNLQESFQQVGPVYRGNEANYEYQAIVSTFNQCYAFFDKYRSDLELSTSPSETWRTARFPYTKDSIQYLRDRIQRHMTDLIHGSNANVL
jgi:hypothetical protein